MENDRKEHVGFLIFGTFQFFFSFFGKLGGKKLNADFLIKIHGDDFLVKTLKNESLPRNNHQVWIIRKKCHLYLDFVFLKTTNKGAKRTTSCHLITLSFLSKKKKTFKRIVTNLIMSVLPLSSEFNIWILMSTQQVHIFASQVHGKDPKTFLESRFFNEVESDSFKGGTGSLLTGL